MACLAYIAMFAFTVLLGCMAWTAGTQRSISALVTRWRWLLLAAIWSQALLLPAMLEVTPDNWQWLAAVGVGAIMLTGAASLKEDAKIHVVAAIVGFTMLAGWVMVVDSVCLLPTIVCIAAGGLDNWKWRIEIGLIISVYMAIIHQLHIAL